MQEEYLHYLFKNKFLPNTFTTVKGKQLEVLDRGQHHYNAGPDFLEGKIEFDQKIWAGHIEFHVKSSDWIKHGHQSDPNYHNVIAHFVYEHDQSIFINDFEIPTIELKSFIDKQHYGHYLNFKKSAEWIPCANQIHLVDDFHIFLQKEKAMINRLIRKSELILSDIRRSKGNQHFAFWIAVGKIFGGKVNGAAFALLVEKIQPHHLAQLNYDRTDVEAYCFGLAGFLEKKVQEDKYFDLLTEKFRYQSTLFELTPLNVNIWKFSRMRPGNFPTIRIAQFAALAVNTQLNFRALEPTVFKCTSIDLSSYWKQHYHFSKRSKNSNSGLTESFKSLITINAYLPFLFAQGVIISKASLKEKAIEALRDVKAEKNSIVKHWKTLGVKISNAFDSQAVIEQKNEFCAKKKCLSCAIGLSILKPKKA